MFRIRLTATVALLLALASPAQAQFGTPAGRVHISNRTAEPITITCRYYLDAGGVRRNVFGGAWTIQPVAQVAAARGRR